MSSSSSSSSSVLIIVAILVSVAALAIAIHLLLRLLSSHRRNHNPPIPPQSPLPQFSAPATPIALDNSKSSVVDRLPLFSLSSALARQPKSSPDCAICQYPFLPDDTLRLLPACRHAFHAVCLDPWLRTSPTCPLCRATVTSPPPPSLLQPSNSFRVQFGRVSSRRIPSPPKEPSEHELSSPMRAYDLGSSFEYLVDEEVDAVVEEKSSGDAMADSGAAGRSLRLREYVDRFARTASTSFRFSGRWGSSRFEDSGNVSVAGSGWDLEGSARRDAEGLYGLYRWVVGAY